jgi:hypothetical protein
MIPERPDRVPDAIEPLVGYRAWFIAGDLLFPISRQAPAATTSPWDGANRRWVYATCSLGTAGPVSDSMKKRLEHIYSKLGFQPEFIGGPHTVPGESCACGFYAMKKLDMVLGSSAPHVALGRVELAGKVIEYTFGYRAERARITELISGAGDRRSMAELALRLGLPVVWVTPPRTDWRPPSAA